MQGGGTGRHARCVVCGAEGSLQDGGQEEERRRYVVECVAQVDQLAKVKSNRH